METVKRNCDNCTCEYDADMRNVKRGWGLCCSKSCAAAKREKAKPTYNVKRVDANNVRRELWNEKFTNSSTKIKGYTSEGYKIINGIAYNQYDEPIYAYDPHEDDFEHGQWND